MDELNNTNEIAINNRDMIVSSTDAKGNIIYVNDIFCKVSGYSRDELIGKPHNIIRHEDMPRVIFYFLWSTIKQGNSIYAFVKNKAKNGDFYWVKAYVKPIMENGEIRQITSYRKPLNEFTKGYMSNLYKALSEYENTHTLEETLSYMDQFLKDKGLRYRQFIDRLSLNKSIDIANIIDIAKYKNAHILYKYHVINAVKSGEVDIEVKTNLECKFGQMCKSFKNESFTNVKEWQDMLEDHKNLHIKLQTYVDSAKAGLSSEELNAIIKAVELNTTLIFDNLTQVIDGYKG